MAIGEETWPVPGELFLEGSQHLQRLRMSKDGQPGSAEEINEPHANGGLPGAALQCIRLHNPAWVPRGKLLHYWMRPTGGKGDGKIWPAVGAFVS